jgi:hypothetical protein
MDPKSVLSARAWTKSDPALLATLVVASAVVRMVTLRTIDLGGDATFKWFFVRSWRYANAWVFDHHTARFSINLPIWVVQRAIGSHPNGMYVLPLLAAIGQVPLLYACGLRLGARTIGVIAALLLLLFDPAADAASQLLPGIFQALYVLGSLACVLHFSSAAEPRRRWLVFAALWLFAGYLAMVTTIYVFPGVALAVWLRRGGRYDLAVFFGTFAALFALETLGYALWSPYPFGQFQLILHTHTDVRPTGWLGLFGRYAALPRDWRAVLVGWVVCAIAWLILRRSQWPQRQPLASSGSLWLFPASLLAGMTFGVKSLDPIIPATDFSVRYFDVLTPLIALGISSVFVSAGQNLRHGQTLRKTGPLLAAGSAFAIGASAWAAIELYRPERSAWSVTSEQVRILNDAFVRGLPIIAANRSDHLQMKTLTCIEWAYLDDSLLLADGELRLHKLGKVRGRNRTRRYLTRETLAPETVEAALKSQRCLVSVARRDSEPKLDLHLLDGPDCPLASGS